MSDISNQLIKDSFNYVLQSDLDTGIVYRIGGDIPENPQFTSGLTVSNGFKFEDSPQDGYFLKSDAFGNASWALVTGSGTSGSAGSSGRNGSSGSSGSSGINGSSGSSGINGSSGSSGTSGTNGSSGSQWS